MRNIEERIIDAVNKGAYFNGANSRVVPIESGRALSTEPRMEVWLHATCIASIYADRVVINTGGWHTHTTKSRLNAILTYYTNYYIKQKDYAWTVEGKGYSEPFVDGFAVPRR